MRKTKSDKSSKAGKTVGRSFYDWRKRFFPDDVKREQIESLQKDATQLGQTLADSTIDRLIHRRAS